MEYVCHRPERRLMCKWSTPNAARNGDCCTSGIARHRPEHLTIKRRRTMEFIDLQIKSFGRLINKTIRFRPGINLFYGENETGKTTLCAALRAMLYGLERGRGRAARTDEYTMRRPWEEPGQFGGILRFESGGKIFRLERSFLAGEKAVSLICETDGEELDPEQGDLQMLMGELSEAAYRNTYQITQGGSATDSGLAAELQRFMSNLQSAGEAEMDVAGALASLEAARRQAEAKQKERLKQAEAKRRSIEERIAYLQKEAERLDAEERERAEHIRQLQKERRRLPEEEETAAPGQGRRALLILLLVFALCGCILMPQLWVKGLLAVVCLILAGLLFFSWRQAEREAYTGEESTQREAEERRLAGETEKEKGHLEYIRKERQERRTMIENLQEELKEVAEEICAEESPDQEVQALHLAIQELRTASEELSRIWSRRLNSRVSQILSEITEGRYTSVYLDGQLNIRIHTPGKILDITSVSRGTMEQIYFALRMAAGELLSQGEPIPVILDEAFAMYDDNRLQQTLRWLKESRKQVLLFTCHRREGEILQRIEM